MDPITSTLPLDSTPPPAADPSQANANDSQNEFLILLVAQLKGQDPMNPVQGSEFVAQLAQFSSLEELTKIRTSMDSVQQLLTQSAANASQPDATKPDTTQPDATQPTV